MDRPGVLGERGVHDVVVSVVADRWIEGATAGDQAEFGCRLIEAEDLPRKVALGVLAGAVDGEVEGPTGRIADEYLVARFELVEAGEDGRAGRGVDMAGDDGRTDLAGSSGLVVPANLV